MVRNGSEEASKSSPRAKAGFQTPSPPFDSAQGKAKEERRFLPSSYQLPLTRELLLSQTRPKLVSGHALGDFLLSRAGQAPNSFSSLEGSSLDPHSFPCTEPALGESEGRVQCPGGDTKTGNC